jgi:endonuclease YncB( thermonuclease family)
MKPAPRFLSIVAMAARMLVAIAISFCPTTLTMADDSTAVLLGQVVKVVDGDTVDVQLASGPIRVRLYGVDAPEKAQPHGKEATAALSKWVLGRQVEVEPFQQDRYDRMIGIVRVGPTNVNAAMVGSGDAWAYRRYMKKADAALCSMEIEARLAKRGLWALARNERIAPWEYRARKKRESFTDYGRETLAICIAAIGKR